MQPEVIVPIAFFFFVIGLPMTFWMISRFLAHQERVEMIRRGFMPPPVPPDPRQMRKAMQYGMPPNVAGAAGQYFDPGYYAQHQLRRGIQVAFIGLALLIGLSFIGTGSGHLLGPWLLGGLIPMFVGIAQIISAVLGGAQLGIPAQRAGAYQQPRDAEAPPAGSTAGTSGPPPPPSSYGGWRPGPIPEIEKPPGPPDYRP